MDVTTIIFIVVEVFIGIIAITGNTIVCYVVLHSPLRKKVMYMFVTSLALADICVALTSIPFSILSKLGLPHAPPLVCMAMLSFIVVPTQISIFNILAVAVERYLAIRCPIIHHNKLTPKRSVFVIFVTWLLSALIGMLPLFGWNNIGYGNQENGGLTVPQYKSYGNHTFWNSTLEKVGIELVALNTANFTTDKSNFFSLQQNTTTWNACIFMKVMNFDYMFFNFVACVLPPLVASAILYSIIFSWLLKIKRAPRVKSHTSPILVDVSNTAKGLQQRVNQIKSLDKYERCFSSTEESPSLKKKTPVITLRGPNNRKRKRCYSAPSGDEHNKLTPEEQQLLKPLRILQENEKLNSIELQKRNFKEDLRIKSLKTQSGIYDLENKLKDIENIKESNNVENKTQNNKDKKTNDFELKPPNLDWRNGTVFPKIQHHSTCSSPIFVRSRCDSLTSQSTKKSFHDGKNHKKMREFKAAAVLALLVLSFTVCWLPIHILNTIHRFDYSKSVFLRPFMFDIAVILSHTNSAINFFLYAWRLKLFRKYLHSRVLINLSAIFLCKPRLAG